MSDMNFQYQINGKSVEVRFSESSPFVDIWESSPETIDQAKFLCHWVGVQFQLFNKSSLYIEELGVPDLSNYEGLVFFPGSFHPWHDGHRACLDESGRDIIIVLSGTKHIVYPGFLALDRRNPTVDWLPKVLANKKELIIGDDSFVNLPDWKDSEKLVESIDVLHICPRDEDLNKIESSIEWMKSINSNCELRFLNNHPFQHLSSTLLRTT